MRRFTIIQATDFNLLNRFRAGEDIKPVLEQRATTGFNYLRVWTAYNIDRIGRAVPREQPNFYSAIPAFVQLCANYGLYVELTAATGPWGGIFDTEQEKLDHWNQLIASVGSATNVSLEVINEANNAPNQPWPVQQCQQPGGLLASHGSNLIDDDPVTPVWNVAGFHPGADPRKWGHNAMERADMFHIPIWSGETVRFPDNDSSTVHAFDGAAAAALLCAGACFHSVNGKLGQLWTGQELACAQAWAQGALSVPLEFQAGFYRHRDDLEGPGIVRAYSRTLPDGREFVVLIHG